MIYFAEYFNAPWLVHVKPWAGLFLCAIVLSWWNWRAAVAFCVGIIMARLCVHFLPQPKVGVIVGYGLLAAVSLFFWDVVAGWTFAVISVLALAHTFYPPFVMFSEVALIVGMVSSGFTGPNGGIYLGGNPRDSIGRNSDMDRIASYRLPAAAHHSRVEGEF